MKKNEIYEGFVEYLDFPNKGRVRLINDNLNKSDKQITNEGKIDNKKIEEENNDQVKENLILVKNTIPGQKIRFKIKKARKGREEGILMEVLEKSSLENGINKCPHFEKCGGCAYHTLSYQGQRDLKLQQVKKLLEKSCKDIELDEICDNPRPYEYRNKMEFSFGDEIKGGPLSLGMHKKGSFYDIVNVFDCQIVDEDYRKILKLTQSYFESKKIDFYHKMSHEGFLRHLLVRKAWRTNEILICLVTSSQISQESKKELIDGYKERILEENYQGTIAGILHMINDTMSDVVKADSIDLLYGRDYFYEEILGLKFKISPFSFFQTNSAGAEVLYKKAMEFIGDINNQVVFDLYSGTGTIAQIMAPQAKKVVGVEIVEEAVEAAKENAKLNGLENCHFICGDVLKVVDELEEKPDTIILDPPRDGIHPKAINKIINFNVDNILYISCKPTSLARDLPVFIEAGYRVKKAACVEIFTWTRGIETVVQLVNIGVKPD